MMNSRPGSEIADGIVQWIVFLLGKCTGNHAKIHPNLQVSYRCSLKLNQFRNMDRIGSTRYAFRNGSKML